MNNIIYQKSYKEYKAELDGELQRTAEGFVKIGYLLKVARDTNILYESGYKNVTEFARAEYGIDKTQVSRFISINDKFSEEGYSDHLESSYQGYGYAKLTIMLQLPDALNEELSPEFSKAEIQAIKDEVTQENNITDIEVMLEKKTVATEAANNLMKIVIQLGEDDPEMYRYMFLQHNKANGLSVESIKDDMCPNEEKIYSVRVAGLGRLMLSLKTAEDTVKIVNVRSGEKEEYSWQQLKECWESLVDSHYDTVEEDYKATYDKAFPGSMENDKVAPVQQTEGVKKPEPRKESKVVKAKQEELHDIDASIPIAEPKKEEKPEDKPEADVETSDEQVEGQTQIEDFEEFMPKPSADLQKCEDNLSEVKEEISGNEAESQESESETHVSGAESQEDEPAQQESEKPSSLSNNILRGYKAAVTNNLNTLSYLWNGDRPDKIKLMINTARETLWRLEKLSSEEDL